ncbi:hypothetical protein [Serratia phage vB_SmaS_Opt-169]|nr:hypothetical protein [Serratia phage vB_SmaS_Opt-169]
MNKFKAINLIKSSNYRTTKSNADGSKTIIITVDGNVISVINGPRLKGGDWFVHMQGKSAQKVKNRQQAYSAVLDEFIIAIKKPCRISLTCVSEDCDGEKRYHLRDLVDGQRYEYIKGEVKYKTNYLGYNDWEYNYDFVTVAKINNAIKRHNDLEGLK